MKNFSPIEFESYEAIAAKQMDLLGQLLVYLKDHSPFYQRMFREFDIEVCDIKEWSDLRKIPTTTKDDFNKHNYEFLCVPKHQIVDYATTSGTTGAPVTVALTENDLQRLAYNEEQSFLTAGCNSGTIFQLMLTLDRQFMAGMAYYLGIRKMNAAAVRVGPVSPQMQWENIFRFQPDYIVAVPSFILKLIEYAEQQRLDLSHCSVKKAICIGEPIRFSDLSANTLQHRIKEKWDIELVSTYASTEMQTAFTECSHGKGGHLRPELLIVEILDDDGNPSPSGTAGEVVITTLGVEGMPLLRYRTGDICYLINERCSCGRNSPRISPVVGRKNQMIKYKGTTIFPPSIFDALSAVEEIKDYLIEVTKNDLGTDEVCIHISQVGNLDLVEPKIKNRLQAKLRVIPALNFISTAQIQSMRPAETRKPTMILFR